MERGKKSAMLDGVGVTSFFKISAVKKPEAEVKSPNRK